MFGDILALPLDNDSNILKDEAGRSFNINVGDKVYITIASWTGNGASDVTYMEARVKVIHNDEISFNDVYYWTN